MIFDIEKVCVSFKKENQIKLFGKERQQVLKDISLQVKEGECYGIIGESGSGKSTLGRVLCGLLKPDSGTVLMDGTPMNKQTKNFCSIVFQDYTTSVNPRFRVIDIIGESLRLMEREQGTKIDRKESSIQLLLQVGLDDTYLYRYPHELSGGQLQRVCIARAIAVNPKVILFDEAISSLDASTQVQVMDKLKELKEKRNFTYIFITHDLSAVTYICDRVAFFHNGEVVERVEHIHYLSRVKTPYAKQLLSSIMGMDYE